MSVIRQQEHTIVANRLNMLGRRLFGKMKKTDVLKASHTFRCAAATLGTPETVCSLSKVEQMEMTASPADVYVYGHSLILPAASHFCSYTHTRTLLHTHTHIRPKSIWIKSRFPSREKR